MSINCVLNEMGSEPLRFEDEYFILKRYDISYRIISESNSQYNGKGFFILTSNRLIIIPLTPKTQFRAIEIPLNKIFNEQFKQPLFGKHYLTAKCNPFIGSSFGYFTFYIWFKNKKNSTLIGIIYTLIDSLRNNQGIKHDDKVINLLKENKFNELFPIDPEDSSYFYQIQPPSFNNLNQKYQSEIIILKSLKL